MTLACDNNNNDADPVNVQSALREMKHATAQLDDILQQMCAAKRASTDAQPTSARVSEPQQHAHDTLRPNNLADMFAHTQELPELLNVYMRGRFVSTATDASLPPTFVPLTIQTPFPRTRIVQAACSRFHALLLNDLGMVFAFGHTIDGALGLGLDALPLNDTSNVVDGILTQPRLLTFFFDRLVAVQSVACGGDAMVGAHSAAVTTDGSVYTWGTGVALGNKSAHSQSEPQRIAMPSIDNTHLLGSETTTTTPATEAPHIVSITCGSGFCVALAASGHAFAWGKWSDGRLGLGRIPLLNQRSRKYRHRRQFQSFQLSPKQLCALSPCEGNGDRDAELFVKVACGDAHCVALTRRGEILTWGRGTHGQLGHGATKDALSPTLVVVTDEHNLAWRDVAAGEHWSMALDARGRVWTWGACGGPVLGSGSGTAARTAVITETILQYHYRLLKQSSSSSARGGSATMSPPPPLPQLRWMRPQLVPCFDGVRIKKLSAGRQHACALSSDGDLYVWGDGSAGFSSLPQLVHTTTQSMSTHASRDDVTSDNNKFARTSTTSAIGAEIVERIVCGGDVAIAFTSGSFLAQSMRSLYRQCELLSTEHESLAPAAFTATATQLGVDVALLVSGRRLFAHKLVLARRSDVLRDLIVTEQRAVATAANTEGGVATSPVLLELLLPQLRHDVAAVVLEFMYTENVSQMLDPQSYLVRDVLRAALLYKLPSLERRCRALLDGESSLLSHMSSSVRVAPLDGSGTSRHNLAASKATSTSISRSNRSLADDLAFAFGDPTWSDLTLVVEQHAIHVHRCVLVARSEYFRALLAFDAPHSNISRTDSDEQLLHRRVVHVHETYASMLRVLEFIYNDCVSGGPGVRSNQHSVETGNGNENDSASISDDDDATEQLLEDLVAADKFGLVRFKRLCEHSIRVTSANCLDVLAVADLVHAAHLKQVALAFVQTHLQVVTTAEPAVFDRFTRDFPQLVDELFAHIRAEAATEATLRSWHRTVEAQLETQRAQQASDSAVRIADAGRFPWLLVILTLTFATLYLSVAGRTHMDAHPFVPAMNAVALLGLFGALFLEWI